MSASAITLGVCRFCGCSETQPCDGGCSWSGDDQTLCSSCAAAVDLASDFVRILGVVTATPKAGLHRITATWSALSLAQQQLLVMTCRATTDAIQQALLEALDVIPDDAVTASIELSILTRFLLDRLPQAIGEDESVSEVVIRLLEPHIGSRIVLPYGSPA